MRKGGKVVMGCKLYKITVKRGVIIHFRDWKSKHDTFRMGRGKR